MPITLPDNWFVAQLKPNSLIIAERNLAHQGFMSHSPSRIKTTAKAGKLIDKTRPLFPGYLFVQFDPAVHGWQSINSTRGLTRLLLNHSHRPTPLPQEFMAGLFARSDSQGILRPLDELQVGDRIRVVSGPFAELVTTVDQLEEKDRIRVLINLMGQKVPTFLPRTTVDRL